MAKLNCLYVKSDLAVDEIELWIEVVFCLLIIAQKDLFFHKHLKKAKKRKALRQN